MPDFWLGRLIKARQMDIRLGLPEALDLLVVCVEAGLSLDKSILRTAEEMRVSQPAIADELGLISLEQRAGRPRADAWNECAKRTGVDTVRSLASLIIQADKFGTSVGKALRTHAETLAHAAPAGCRGAGGQNHGEAGLPAGAADLSVTVCGDAGAVHDRHVQGIPGIFRLRRSSFEASERLGKETTMDNVTIIRIVAGICFFIVIAFLIMRRRKKLN